MNNAELMNASGVLKKLLEQDGDDIEVAFKIATLDTDVDNKLETVIKMKESLLKKHGTKGQGGYYIDKDNTEGLQKFYKEFDIILIKEVKGFKKIKLSIKDFKGYKLSGKDIKLLGVIIDIK